MGTDPRLRAAAAAVALILPVALAGCEDPTVTKSSSKHLLALQHRYWAHARKELASEKPNLGALLTVGGMVGERTRRRIEKDYTAPNKAEVLARLDAIRDAYMSQVVARLESLEHNVRLKPGVTLEDVRQAFNAIDKDYRQFEAMTTPK